MMYAVGKLETAINIISHYICYYLLSNIYKSIGSVPEQFVVQSVDVVELPHLSKGQCQCLGDHFYVDTCCFVICLK